MARDGLGLEGCSAYGRLQGYVHPRFGDLSRKDAVAMGGERLKGAGVNESSPAYIHLSVTGKCYARCRGCVNSAVTAVFAGDRKDFIPIADTLPERDAACIVQLAKAHSQGPVVVCFYGGEPFLAAQKMARVRQLLTQSELGPRFKFMVYTSGELLKCAVADFPDLVRSIWLYAVSIDGMQRQHEHARPGTCLARIHDSLAALRKVRSGTVLMWSTLREEQSLTDCFQEFISLKTQKSVDQFFWHWVETGEPFQNFGAYLPRYETELCRVMEVYMEWLGQGRILPITHVNELIVFLLSGQRRKASACGVELAMNYDLIDGKIHSCADLPAELAIGSIGADGTPMIKAADLTFLVDYKMQLGCYECGVHAYCGGRCPVQAFTGGNLRMIQYCQLMRLHVGIVKSYLGDITALLQKHGLHLQDLYDQSAFFAQFTDVTP